jgi:hypothetical protein
VIPLAACLFSHQRGVPYCRIFPVNAATTNNNYSVQQHFLGYENISISGTGSKFHAKLRTVLGTYSITLVPKLQKAVSNASNFRLRDQLCVGYSARWRADKVVRLAIMKRGSRWTDARSICIATWHSDVQDRKTWVVLLFFKSPHLQLEDR